MTSGPASSSPAAYFALQQAMPLTVAPQAPPQPKRRELIANLSGAFLGLLLVMIVSSAALLALLAWQRSALRSGPTKRRRRTDTTSAWAEAGRRMPTPDATGPLEQDLHG
jgi:hypothetical protein